MLHFSVLVTGVPLACSRVSKPLSHPFTPAEVCSHLMLSSNKYFSYIPSFNKSCKFFRVPPYLIFFCYIFWGNNSCALRMQLQKLRGVCGGKLYWVTVVQTWAGDAAPWIRTCRQDFSSTCKFSIMSFVKEKGLFLRESCVTQTPSCCQAVLPLKRLHKDHAASPVWCEGNCCCYLK